ncbi:putative methyltransferase [Variovorax sp. PBL-H6]|uniref:class I SAM-dependent methyltransferase n=1 Tax=Variovorax sp. PBL-H6 TaxID=434009 RepID=UPI001319558E|nr:class I SAM-dependent methyltransferase [Variovorax sp. PBL-H6]VTU21426.1 putative methyltransferase [Variovorax sp. PBL-H6]
MRIQLLPCARGLLAVALLASLIGCAISDRSSAAPTLSRDRIAQIVASPDRSAADRTNDIRRHPVDMLAFIGIKSGWTALDVSTGGGYTTELLARAIGPSGTVYAQSPPRDPNRTAPAPAAPEGGGIPTAAAPPRPQRSTVDVLADREKNMQAAGVAAAHIVYVGQRFDDPVPPAMADGKLDLVTLMFNYHDFGFLGVKRAQLNRAVFRALKPGGLYVIADHAGRPGTLISESGTLHRIEESFLRGEVEAAGFRLAEEGDFLRNPNDPRDRNTPEPPQPKDEFVLKFVKP